MDGNETNKRRNMSRKCGDSESAKLIIIAAITKEEDGNNDDDIITRLAA